MNTSLTVIWTLLPNGYSRDGKLRLSAMASFRPATSDGKKTTLDKFADLLHWPTKVQDLSKTWKVKFANEAAPRVTIVEDAAALDPLLWNCIFPASTDVYPYIFKDFSERRVFSFGASSVANVIRKLYNCAADRGTVCDLCPIRKRICLAADIGQEFMLEGERLHPVFEDGTDGSYFTRYFPSVGDQEIQFCRGYVFYNSIKDYYQPDYRLDIGFLQMVAAISSQPGLMRKLGIVIDLLIDPPLPAPSNTRISLVGLRNTREDVGLQTAVTLSGKDFRATPLGSASDISKDGLLKLDEPDRYVVENLEIDGSMMKVINDALEPRTSETNDDAPILPSLQSCGITILRVRRDLYLVERLARQKNLENSLMLRRPILLTADDILRGYRVDVFSEGVWRSLCYRTCTMKVEGHADFELPSKPKLEASNLSTCLAEGYVSGASSTGPSSTEPLELRIHEAVCGWDGWSLVAARPGRSIPADPKETTPRRIINKTPDNSGYKYYVLEDIKAQPGTLPKLRFGTSYKFRIRAVDLAGNSVSLEAAPDSNASEPILYTRFNPIVTPVLVVRTPFTEGESLEHMVIRSDKGKYAKDYVNDLRPFAKTGAPYNAICERWIAPPKVSYNLAETHGMFDAILKPKTDIAINRAYDISKKESGTFSDTHVWDTSQEPVVKVLQTGREVVTPPGIPSGVGPLSRGQYVVHSTKPKLPYLPDPLASGFVTLKNGGDSTRYKDAENLVKRRWTGTWPEIVVGRLILQEATDPSILYEFSNNNEGLTIALRKGTMFEFMYASTIDKDNIRKMALFNDDKQDASAIADGKHPMFTPCRKITFVHAVQRPTAVPVAEGFTASRINPGDTFAIITGSVKGEQAENLIGNSTGSITAVATWFDLIDLLGDKDPTKPVQFTAHPFEIKVEYDEESVKLVGPKFSQLRHEFGDTKARKVSYKFSGTTRYREYFPSQITDSPENISVEGSPTEVDIASSARPPVPKILYVLPTFRWNDDTTSGKHVRTGRGLRVYVDRPWYVSGTEEMLAVVIDNNQGTEMTVLGRDPIWTSSGGFLIVDSDTFVKADSKTKKPFVGSYSLSENKREVTVIGYSPQFNSDRQTWYFDIELENTNELNLSPFLRLELARLQRYSLPGLELSVPVFTDYVTIAPDRAATLVVKKENIVNVTVSGYYPSTTNTFPKRAVVAQVEKVDIANPEADDLGWEPYGTIFELKVPDGSTDSFIGEVPVPPPGSAPPTYRLSIRELEYYASDDDTKEGVTSEPYRTRIVYAFTRPLPL